MPILKRDLLMAEASDKSFLTGASLATAIAAAVTSATSATKLKEIKVAVPGTYRTRFGLRFKTAVGAGTRSLDAQVYVNGIVRGQRRVLSATQNDTNNPPTAYVEDIPGITFGDLIQIYAYFDARVDVGDVLEISGFNLLAEFAPRMSPYPLVGSVNL